MNGRGRLTDCTRRTSPSHQGRAPGSGFSSDLAVSPTWERLLPRSEVMNVPCERRSVGLRGPGRRWPPRTARSTPTRQRLGSCSRPGSSEIAASCRTSSSGSGCEHSKGRSSRSHSRSPHAARARSSAWRTALPVPSRPPFDGTRTTPRSRALSTNSWTPRRPAKGSSFGLVGSTVPFRTNSQTAGATVSRGTLSSSWRLLALRRSLDTWMRCALLSIPSSSCERPIRHSVAALVVRLSRSFEAPTHAIAVARSCV